ncbi:hypothetical protein SH611_14665 [Geminicoccaceae bacterium 1502E]|nr:hypothetical protein [Geminicoccaceae bacterium 1502E]
MLVGTGALVWLVVTREDKPVGDAATASLEQTVGSSDAAPARLAGLPPQGEPVTADLPLPEGAMVVDMRSEGGRVVLLLRAAAGEEYIAVVDAATGERRLLLRLVAETP